MIYCHHISSQIRPQLLTDSRWTGRGGCLYPNGVIHHSPGSRLEGAHPGSNRSLATNPEGVLHADNVYNPFRVDFASMDVSQGALSPVATLGCGVQPLRGTWAHDLSNEIAREVAS